MNVGFKILLLFTFLYSQLCNAQYVDEFLPKTIVFKLKEANRNVASKTTIDNIQLNKLFNELGLVKLQKKFPNKLKEERVGFVDLSLIYEFTYTNNYDVAEAIILMYRLKLFDYVEPHFLPKLCYTPSDTLISNQWYITKINAENAWNTSTGDTNIVIGITDTGWDPTHPDLIGNVKKNYNDPINGFDDDADGYIDNFLGWDLANDDNDALWESTSHGVNVSGIAAATTDNVTGIAGVGFNTKFLPVKISNSAGQLTHAYEGIVYAADHGTHIINCSWGGYSTSQFNQSIIDYAIINKGCIVIGAMGNDNSDDVFYPAGFKGVLSVAGTLQTDVRNSTSNYGFYADISAPGDNMQTTGANGGYGINGGTSMAAPVVSGAAAILKSQFPSYTNQQIAALIQATADDISGLNSSYVDQIGTGRVNLFNAINASSSEFMELTNHIATDNNNNVFVAGDTLEIETFFTNYLDPLTGLSITLSSTSPYVNIIDGNALLPNVATQAVVSNNSDKFLVQILAGAPQNEKVTFKVVLSNGSYTNNEYFNVTLNTDYINLEENLVTTTITSNGKIGFNDVNNSVGLGFTYDGKQLMYECGLMIGDGVSRVADVIRDGANQDFDFSSVQNVALNPPYKSAKDLYNILNDSPLTSSMNIDVEQYSYVYANSPDDKYVIVVYKILNTGTTTLNNLYAGLFADWDIENPNNNKSGFDASRNMGYVYSLTNDSIYAAIKLLSGGSVNNYSLDLDGSGGIDINGSGFPSSEKYGTLSTSRNFAGGVSGNDVAHVVSSGSFSLNQGEKIKVAFALIAGDSLQDIQASADAAQIKYNNDALSVEQFNFKDDLFVYPNPTKSTITINSQEKIKCIDVKNYLGQILFVQKGISKTLSLNNYPNGIYFIEIKTENSTTIQKIILNK